MTAQVPSGKRAADDRNGGVGHPADVRIGPPGFARVWSVVFGVVWVVVLTSFFVKAWGNGATAPVFIAPVMLVAGLAIIWRNNVLGIRSDGDVLTVRGPYSTRRVNRDQVAEVRRGEQASTFRSPAVVVTTKDGAMIIGPPTTLAPFGRRSQEQVDHQVEQVRSWLRG